MTTASRILPRVRPMIAARTTPPRFAPVSTIKAQTPPAPIEPSQTQAMPVGPFYQAMLDYRMPYAKEELPASTSVAGQQQAAASASSASPETKKTPTEQQEEPNRRPAPAPSSPPPAAATTAAEKASIIFGSALAGPQARADRLAEARKKSKLVAGVWVPPRPEEPDNCCMSGCVNCVWDQYRDEMEDWSAAHSEAQARLREMEERREQGVAPGGRGHEERRVDVSMDDDGGGSETNWVPEKPKAVGKDMWDDELYANIPVGIREFMKTEKMLKMRHEREGTTGG